MKAWSRAWHTARIPATDGGAEVVQMRRTGKGCLSYLIGSGGEATVIDASVAPRVYVELAEEHDWKITHVHAEHLSRSKKLTELTGARLRMPRERRSPTRSPCSRTGTR